MKRKFVTFLYLLFFIATVNSQNFTITGKVVDATSLQELEYATIVFKHQESKEIFGGVTDKKGNFKIDVPQGKHTITIEFISYKPHILEGEEINNDIHFGTIELNHNFEALDTVSVNQEKKATEIKLNKIIYNVDKDILSNGGTATDILTNIPSVTMSNGIPKIRNSEPQILINGKISSRSKPEVLVNLPASSIQKIEVITTPSAKYSGNSSGGIINIILKKGLDNGFNGSVTASGTINQENIYGVATSLNYRKDKLNIYTNTNLFHRSPIANTIIENEYSTNDVTDGFLIEDRKYTRKNIVFQSTIGIDYFFDDYKSLNIESSFSGFNGDFSNINNSDYFDASNSLSRKTERKIKTDHNNDIFEISATYDQYFERENEELYFYAFFQKDAEVNDRYITNRDFYPMYQELPNEDEKIYEDLDLQNVNWYIAYVLPLSDMALLEIGHESELGSIKHDFFNEIIDNGDFIPNPNTSNLLYYDENWFRFYGQYDQSFEKLSIGLGINIEHTNIKINSVTTNESSSQKFTNLLPSASIGYTLNESNSFSFSYRRDLYRMGYEDLNPFEQRISETTSFKGNINLLPIYGNSFEISFLNSLDKKLRFKPSLYFKNYTDWLQNITYETGEIINGVPKLITMPINIGSLNRLGIELITSYYPNDWLSFISTIDLRHAKQTGIYEYTDSNNELVKLDYNNAAYDGYIKLNTSMAFPNNFNFQAMAEYQLPSQGAYSKREGYIYMNASASKDIFNKKATISLIADNIFNSNKVKRTRWTDDVTSYSNSQWKEPSILLSFTFRFNQSKKNKKITFDDKDDKVKE